MKVLITGATGLIGQEIVKICHQSNIWVNYLTTSKEKIKSQANYQGYYWDPYKGEIDEHCFEDVEVIINMVGAPVSERWTKSYKKEIIDSRVVTASLILKTLKEIKNTVRHIVSASAIGIYPDSLQNYYTEESTAIATNFLGEVVEKWENAINEFEEIDIEVSKVRIGLVLAEDGGAYPKISKPVEYGLGAAFGSGKQWQSWIHIDDLAKIFVYVIKEELYGVFNAVAPNPVSNEKLTQTIAEVKNKKIRLPNVPEFIMKLVLGEMHVILYSSQRVSGDKIIQRGFQFEFDHIQQAVKQLES